VTQVPSKPRGEEPRPGDKPSGPPTPAAVRAAVLAGLGRPDGLFRVDVLSLWGGRFRVNVLTGPDATTTRIAHSFFVTTDEAGSITATCPAIPRLYA